MPCVRDAATGGKGEESCTRMLSLLHLVDMNRSWQKMALGQETGSGEAESGNNCTGGREPRRGMPQNDLQVAAAGALRVREKSRVARPGRRIRKPVRRACK